MLIERRPEPAADGQLALPLDLPEEARTEHVPLGEQRITVHLVVSVLEVLSGRRPLVHVEQLFTGNAYSHLAAWVRNETTDMRGLSLRSLHACRPQEGVIEAFGTVAIGERTKALTARLERHRSVWRCTLLWII